MASYNIDVLARRLAHENDRRRLIRSLVAGLAVSLGGDRRPAAAGGCKKVGQTCDRNGDCCAGGKCQGDECRCKSGFDECDGKCFRLNTDENHCGACDTTCNAAETCCGGECLDVETDRANCGGCGIACATAEICLAGECVLCPIGNQICGDVCCPPFRTCCDGRCVDDVQFNRDHCGACGTACAADEVCDEGRCDPCPSGFVACGNTCCRRNTGPVCLPGRIACGEVCCATGESCCGGECVDLDGDEDHCGRCRTTCQAGESCCGGDCVDLQGNDANCGACGNHCAFGVRCRDGECSVN